MNRILLYGATGYQGKLIADEAARRRDSIPAQWHGELVLASRDRAELKRVADSRRFEHFAFGLDDRDQVVRALRPFDVVINAASPFALTAPRLARAALDAKCRYVDIVGEMDVYRDLDDLNTIARQRRLALVCGAGCTASASDVLLDLACKRLKAADRLGDLRRLCIAVTQIPYLSRGSVRTMLSAVREQVTVLRLGRYQHVPVGQLERSFDFSVDTAVERKQERRRSIASAANLLDTLTAKNTLRSRPWEILTPDIESYIEMRHALRLGYEFAAASAVSLHLSVVRRLAELQLSLLPEGPSPDERLDNGQTVAIEVEDQHRSVIARWALAMPDPYEVTARTVLDVAERLALPAAEELFGFLTPSAVICWPDRNPLDPAVHPKPAFPFTGSALRDQLASARKENAHG
ncbi:saccharopine dehydrogenase NADP-binding domain-containing protein [Variovorax saccharolyticus]|uniref:saccharopine dehydrogenase NADP-binding domain-containing protein n=1 Tax=Variovorax saccharolyticus TaxID=3053516 RepID=UPI0025782419|nr:saccharopine dehydrogenase NADP-binding domain-containing protein [Variovorax sp. J31P216]MDM0026345.1 saccharopine dehydrogenase NADP-binding domain-containing protein [Variovorax sp. J31P216]